MNFYELVKNAFSAMINQALTNQANRIHSLPPEQEEAKEKILDAIHNICENKKKITVENIPQVQDAIVLKIASELGWINGGLQ
ncbi:MAG: hypothetical protein NC094_08375 [Bacteroidales bacterium]|nr:hypothetical protein [Lachnoclostridium sp.]MCM1384029.1 hypothetical protein [Lachnoclostridium sp.]MCM1465419.1 hypothetical protein [Bacteroidales bacterium]